MGRYTNEQIATIIRGKAVMVANGQVDMPNLDAKIAGLTADGAFENLSEQEAYWIARWLDAGVKDQQKEAKNMEKYLARSATVADVYQIVGASLRDMFGQEILNDTQAPNDKINLAISTVHTIMETLINKGVVSREDFKAQRDKYLEEIKKSGTDSPEGPDSPENAPDESSDAPLIVSP